MTEHTHTGEVRSTGLFKRAIELPHDWPVGAEVTVTWTEPDPEPTGRWVVVPCDTGEHSRPMWEDSKGVHWTLSRVFTGYAAERDRAEAALVDLIEPDHLPPQMPSVDDIHDWLMRNGYGVGVGYPTPRQYRTIIRGTLDAIAALDAHARGPE